MRNSILLIMMRLFIPIAVGMASLSIANAEVVREEVVSRIIDKDIKVRVDGGRLFCEIKRISFPRSLRWTKKVGFHPEGGIPGAILTRHFDRFSSTREMDPTARPIPPQDLSNPFSCKSEDRVIVRRDRNGEVPLRLNILRKIIRKVDPGEQRCFGYIEERLRADFSGLSFSSFKRTNEQEVPWEECQQQ